MGSIWWECLDIGGVAEKVPSDIGGLQYRARDPVALAWLLESLPSNAERFQKLVDSLPPYKTVDEYATDHLNLYRRFQR